MKLINSTIIESNKYKFTVKCDNCGSQYDIIGNFTYIKNVLKSVGHGCPFCGKTNNMSLDKFLFKVNELHLYEKFEYPNIKTEYVDGYTDITIICKEHGKFKCSPYKHIKTTNGGCSKCIKNNPISKELWLTSVNNLNNYKYKYPYLDTEYNNLGSIITIECPVHGEFKQLAGLHYRGCGCKRCNGRGIKFDKNDKLNILTKYDLTKLHWTIILDLIGSDKLPKEFHKLCKYGENTPERKKMVQDLIDTYNIDVEEVDTDETEDNTIDENIEVEVSTIPEEELLNEDIYNEDEAKELEPLKEIKEIADMIDEDDIEVFSTGDKWTHIISKEMSRLWNSVLRDNENHNTNTIDNIKNKLNETLTKFEEYVYNMFLKEYEDVVDFEVS